MMKLGVMAFLDDNVEIRFSDVSKLGFDTCQLVCWNDTYYTDDMAKKVIRASRESGVEITAFWCGWPGPAVWNFIEGPLTLGLVPPEYRFIRMEVLKKGSEFAKKINVSQLATHVGFIPEDPNDRNYKGLLATLRVIVAKCKENGQKFLFETGQETPVTLKRAIEELGFDNVGINLDPANLLLYGKANPIDALDIFGQYVCGVHAKDGEYPTNGMRLGEEKPLGEGRVNFPALIEKLKKLGYDGAITIEREISGEQQIADILKAKKILERLI